MVKRWISKSLSLLEMVQIHKNAEKLLRTNKRLVNNHSEEMASLPTTKNIPRDENSFKASKKHKNKKTKKEKKDKSKKHVPDFLFHDGCHEAVFTQTQETKKRKKSKTKSTPKEDFQQPKLNKQLKKPKDTHQIQPIIHISPDQETPHSTQKECYRSMKRKKRVIFNLPPEQIQVAKTNNEEFRKKQLVSESSLESNTAEEMNSQDLFITQKTFLDSCVEISSGSSCSEATTAKALENRSQRSTAEATTQTENFFTSPVLSTSLRFQQQNTSKSTEEPVDLSLPNRTRQIPKRSTVDSAQPLKLKISDTSSEDSDTVPKAKGDLLQLKVIQTRLNESFFFKVKGEDSPKPMCPLMKLTESVEKKLKK